MTTRLNQRRRLQRPTRVGRSRGGAAGAAGAVHPTDSFNRPFESLSGSTADSGDVWTVHNGSWDVGPFVALMTSSTSASVNTASIDFGAADGTVSVYIEGSGSVGGAVGLSFRMVDNNNWWGWFHDSGTLYLQRRVSGSYTTVFTTAYTFVAGDKLSVDLSGTSIICKLNDVTQTSQTSSVMQANTRHGLQINTATGRTTCNFRVDDFDFLP